MATTQQLLDERAGIWAQAQEFNARSEKGEALSAEDEASWKACIADVGDLTGKINTRNENKEIEASFATIDDKAREQGAAAGAPVNTLPGGLPSVQDEYRETFMKWAVNGMEALDHDERTLMQSNFGTVKDAQSTTTTAGGYTVPQGFQTKLTEVMKFYGGAAAGAEILTTDSGNPLVWPANNDTANVGYQLAENATTSSEGDLAFTQLSLGAWTFVSGPILLSVQLGQDSGLDFEGILVRKMGQRLGRIENTKQTTGAGTTTPQGYITGATTGVTTASPTAIVYGELVDLIHSVDPAYRATGRCQFKLHDLILAYVQKITDSQGRPLWQPSLQAGQPDTLLGYGLTVNNDQASTVAATNKTVAFGDFESAFVIRRVLSVQVMRLVERYADALQVGFIGYERMDSAVQDASAVKLLLQHA